ncbi:hypothetical protein A6M21_05795 [Desulfotomaculum copahuensis]|uniref:Uncharacterized protein n=1 Tax=Desulfotomaculum copahuensis TaxID=1838280 RepID=A0A1B7LGV5_9FIRM|nr:hypothetical protein A6M21_05795 [Desulfotomaculum copahuensis]
MIILYTNRPVVSRTARLRTRRAVPSLCFLDGLFCAPNGRLCTLNGKRQPLRSLFSQPLGPLNHLVDVFVYCRKKHIAGKRLPLK